MSTLRASTQKVRRQYTYVRTLALFLHSVICCGPMKLRSLAILRAATVPFVTVFVVAEPGKRIATTIEGAAWVQTALVLIDL